MALKKTKKVISKVEILDLGDTALLINFQEHTQALHQIHQLCEALFTRSPPWLLDAIPGIDTLLVSLRFQDFQYALIRSTARAEINELLANILGDKEFIAAKDSVHRIRVCYDPALAPDLLASAEKCKLTVREFINRHKNSEITVDILGFMPGFAYCSGLDPSLKLPRLEKPRTGVPPGSVAIAELQTAIYPKTTPGGWNIIGRSPDLLFDPLKERPSLLHAGDRVQFIEIDIDQFKKIQAEESLNTSQHIKKYDSQKGAIEVISSGLLTTIQALPRYGLARLALSAGGPMDKEGARLANALVGNSEQAAGLEITGTGPKLLFHLDTWVAWVGSYCAAQIDGEVILGNRPVFIRQGQTLSFGKITQGYRIFLAFSGGIESEFILGGCGSHLSAGIGDKQVQKGDILYLPKLLRETPMLKKLKQEHRTHPKWSVASPSLSGKNIQLIKAIPSMHLNVLNTKEQASLWKTVWTVSSQSNRMGMRLDGNFSISAPITGIASQGIWFGTVQLPPSGQPILMMAEHATTGGYPRLVETIESERSKLAQLRPGDKIQFVPITLEEADQINAVFFGEQKVTVSNIKAVLEAKS
ncbi:5-oxoprolinase/urea amidolyase family protein [Polynucleobacter sp. AP-Elch-400A-B2]|uniref:5-oxoprolinase subunit B/C family protein n=1 Tax=Polynucleobacter sp. AP-Elch-400A-B2 TaxID=2576930 RepID=UPI001BFD127A|nr:5-oxoprolinase/urea amidolyase family protein [Polynucleobacter sp. AP-Elch-400A-B2]QWE24132.1 5-oxoprolinase/urea amidolyase family protein [Polynucleobacter sp. AP-Elch-400A-B2]